jgi:organic radical activating enzyme
MPPGTASSVISAPKLLSILLTYQCTAACSDCGTFSSPQEDTHLDTELALRAIRQAPEAGFGVVVFTGGEPTMRWPALLRCLEEAHAQELSTRVVTNGYWAKTPAAARRRVATLVEHGLDELNVSTGDQHARFVPVEAVARAAAAGAEAGCNVAVMVEIHDEAVVTADTFRSHEVITTLPDEVAGRIVFTESPWMPVDHTVQRDYPEGVAVTADNIGMRTGCQSVLHSYTLQADGGLTACCGLGVRTIPELRVGDENNDLVGAIEEAESDVLKLLVHYIGPEKLLRWAATKDPDIVWEGLYAHTCHACLRLYHDPRVGRVVNEHHRELLGDLVAAMVIDEAMVPAL